MFCELTVDAGSSLCSMKDENTNYASNSTTRKNPDMTEQLLAGRKWSAETTRTNNHEPSNKSNVLPAAPSSYQIDFQRQLFCIASVIVIHVVR